MNKATFGGAWGFKSFPSATHYNFVQYRYIPMPDKTFVKFIVHLNVRKRHA